MAAPITCRICRDVLPTIKRRQIFSKSFRVENQLAQVLFYTPQSNDGLSMYVCVACHSKLNKISKIDYDLQHKLDTLRAEKTAIISALRHKMSTLPTSTNTSGKLSSEHSYAKPSTSTGNGKRKFIPRTPTPRKLKRPLLTTPVKQSKGKQLFREQLIDVPGSTSVLAEPLKGVQTESSSEDTADTGSTAMISMPVGKTWIEKKSTGQFSPGHMKVQHRVKGQVRTHVIRRTDSKSIVASISRGDTDGCIAKKILDSDLKASVTEHLLKNLEVECKNICATKKATQLRIIKPVNMRAMNFEAINAEFKTEAPLLYKTLSCLTGGSVISNTVAGALCLFHRNQNMSLVQHVVGQVLDHSGATDEAIRTLNKLGMSVSTSSVASQRKALQTEQQKHIQGMFCRDEKQEGELGEVGTSHCVEVIGDNIDITRTPSQMSKERSRKSWHWFLLVGVKKRVLFPNLPDGQPKGTILETDNAMFVPNQDDCKTLESNFIHHIMHILVKYVSCLHNLKDCLPDHIEHPYERETSQKTDYAVLDMLDKSENKSEDMISILEHVHDHYIPHDGDPPNVIKKKVFGGDCLTNERAYAAQLALLNSPTDHTRLTGVIHRPEGLHRTMNLCLFIYQQFYKQSSSRDAGTLYQLRNVLGRVNVHGPKEVVSSYRAHNSFIQDCLDGYVVGACMDLLGLDEPEGEPKEELPSLHNKELKLIFLKKIATQIMEQFIKLSTSVQSIHDNTVAMASDEAALRACFDAEIKQYVCECGTKYKTKGYFQRHLQKVHQYQAFEPDAPDPSETKDSIAAWRGSFMKCALLLRDTQDAYQWGDGSRIARNSKFEMLLCDVGYHTKYKLWHFIFQAYISSILTERQSMEYKWNCTANTLGGAGRNIPNDNLVELTVQAVKKKIHQQGANATYQSARSAALSMQMQSEVRDNLMKQCKADKTSTARTPVVKSGDIKLILQELKKSDMFKNQPGRMFEGFPNFKDLFSKVKTDKLFTWITVQKKRLSVELL